MGAAAQGVCKSECCQSESGQEMKFQSPRKDNNEVGDPQIKMAPILEQQRVIEEPQKPQLIGIWKREADDLAMDLREADGQIVINWDARYKYPATPIYSIAEGVEMDMQGIKHRATWDKESAPQRLMWSDGE
eukprot:CAMPEP_0169186638 /NCGR_PEP_ID=MMETSP1016-20121227/2483_1 /TAXON_ID=342587 /ORGANISM="Karlodinium micrum, Strain CCMP2283" /LENGTH=131 /DNA_ID=CAMNT_0009262515 /DNA_START=32 /DNA_END=424 /DNA_ORIENTATION=-